MNKFSRKVAIIGVGNVGTGTASTILNQNIADELLLIDTNTKKAYGEALDMANAVSFLNAQTKVRVGTYQDMKDVDIICISASEQPPGGVGQDRLTELKYNASIVRSIVRQAMDNGFDGIFVLQTNPVDIITYEALKESGLPANRVIGTGTLLDTGRLRHLISDMADDMDIRSIDGFTLGEHGDSQAVIWSSIKIGTQSFLKLRELHPEKYAKISLDEIREKVVRMGWEVLINKGHTSHGIGSAAARVIRCIFNDEKSVIPVSTYLDGEYGQKGIVASVSCIIGKNGMEQIIEIDMTDDERKELQKSFDVIQKHSL